MQEEPGSRDKFKLLNISLLFSILINYIFIVNGAELFSMIVHSVLHSEKYFICFLKRFTIKRLSTNPVFLRKSYYNNLLKRSYIIFVAKDLSLEIIANEPLIFCN